jgi:hypothetical protein
MPTILNALWWTLLRPCKGRGRCRWNAKGRETMRRLRSSLIPPGTLVLQGALLIGEDSFGPQSYVRLLPGQALDLKTQTGCVLYENRRDWTEAEEGSFALAGDRMDWRQGMVPGLKVTSLHEGLTKHTALVRWAPDTRFNPHTHVGGEEILVLAGVFRDEHGAYPAGTWIRSPHMSHHRPFTEAEGATILVKVGHLQVPG